MGAVYHAHDPKLQRDVAIKVLATQDPEASARLLQEARASSALNHPHVCTIYEVGEADGRSFIAMELVAGKPLSELTVAGGSTPLLRVQNLRVALCFPRRMFIRASSETSGVDQTPKPQ